MSSRALRKAQREREEAETLKRLEQEARALEEEEEDEEEEPVPVQKKSAFELLQEQEGDEDEQDEDDLEADDTIPDEPVASAPKSTANKKKKRKKKGKKATEAKDESKEGSDMDEIDAALKELSTNGNGAQHTTAAGVDHTLNEANRLLAIDTSHLHAVNEMRRLFGRAALEADREDGAPPRQAGGGGNRRQQRQQVGLREALRGQRQDGRSGLSAMALRRNIFIQGKEDWPQATSGGLGMEVEEKRADGTILYKFVHNTSYQDVQSQFETCVASMDPQRMIMLLQHNPYHISTLLQVSEIAKQERDFTTAGDLLERALFSFGRAVHSTFSKTLADGKARLDFRRPENREFWLASWRYMQNLTMRATYRTVYEWTKMLLSLSPQDDPYALWLVLDQYALRSKEHLDYINISRNVIFKTVHESMPNVQMSQALAECKAGNKIKGQQLLFTVVGRYPWFVAKLMHELNIDAPPAVWGKNAGSPKEELLAALYATRAKDLWNTPEHTELLLEISSAVPPETHSAPTDSSEITPNVARHVLLSDTPALIALVPREYTSQLEDSNDPLPPHDSIASYQIEHRAPPTGPAGGNRSQQQVLAALRQALARQPQRDPQQAEINSVARFFRELFPWYDQRFPEMDGVADEETPANADEMMTQVREAGRENAFEEHARRLIRLRGGEQPVLDVDRVFRMLTEGAILEPETPGPGAHDLQQLEELLMNGGLDLERPERNNLGMGMRGPGAFDDDDTDEDGF